MSTLSHDGKCEVSPHFEDPARIDRRERHRGQLSRRLADLFSELGALPSGQRLAWYRQNRGDWFFSSDEITARIQLLNQCIPTRRQEISDAADCLVRHEFDILGSGPTPLGDPIDWQRDFKFWHLGIESIVQHARFILDYLEVDADGRRNNHYLNNLVGLAFGAAESARHPVGSALLEFVHQEIEGELSVQFSPDGTNYEGSIASSVGC